MKVSRSLCLCFAIVLPQLALAETSMDAKTLGTVEAAYKFCTRVDPRDAAFFVALGDNLEGSLPRHQYQGLRRSADYARAYETATEGLAKIAKDVTVAACAAAVIPNEIQAQSTHKSSRDRDD